MVLRLPAKGVVLVALPWCSSGSSSSFAEPHSWFPRGLQELGKVPEQSVAWKYGNASDATLGQGFKPSPIVDPKQDIDCLAQECVHACPDHPERICRPYAPCAGQTSSGKVCLHKALWPLLPEDVELFASLFLVAVAAGATGIGGGGLNVPMLLLWSKFDIKEGVPLSHSAVLGNALAMLLVNAPQSNPANVRRPLIYYELALLLLPAMLGGSTVGVMMGRVFPPALLIVLSLVLLVLTAGKTILKANHMVKEARRCRLEEHRRSDCQESDGLPAPHQVSPQPWDAPASFGTTERRASQGAAEDFAMADASRKLRRTWSGDLITLGSKPLMLAALRERASHEPTTAEPQPQQPGRRINPWGSITLLGLISAAFIVVIIVLKAEETCSVGYWLASSCLLVLLPAGIACGAWSLRRLQSMGNEFRCDDDVEVSTRSLLLYPGVTTLIGLVAGLLGLGGGEFTVPLLLELGLHTRVASATSGLLMVFMTLANILHYSIDGTLHMFLGYASTLSCIAFVGGLLGLALRDSSYVKAHNYLMVYLLSGLLAMAAILLAVRGRDSMQEPTMWHMQSYCG